MRIIGIHDACNTCVVAIDGGRNNLARGAVHARLEQSEVVPSSGGVRLNAFPGVDRTPCTRTCRVCGQQAPSTMTGVISNGYPLSSCVACGTVMVERQLDPDELQRVYNHLFMQGAYESHRQEFEMLRSGKRPWHPYRTLMLRRLERRCPGRTLIEIGGGTGAFGILARSRGWAYTDYDISDVAVRFARALGLEAHVLPPQELPPLPNRSADAIAMWEVIEHIWDLQRYLTWIREVLRPGGALIFSTPNYAYRNYRHTIERSRGFLSMPPVHLNFFSRDSLEKSLKLSGFTAIRIDRQSVWRPRHVRGILENLKVILRFEAPPTLLGMAGSTLVGTI